MRLIDADELKKALAEMWYENNIRITGLSVAELIDEAPTIEPIEDIKPCGVSADRHTDQNVADVPSGDITETKFYDTNGEVYATITRPSGDLISREELLKKLDRQIEWEEANAIPYEDADGGCILGLKKARKYVKLASSTEKPNALKETETKEHDDLISRADAIEAGNKIVEELALSSLDWDDLKYWAKELFDALPSADRPNYNLETIADIVKQLGHLDGCIADILDRQQGEWIMHIDDLFPEESTQECSNCHEHENIIIHNDNFCPNCGAIMKGGEE